MKKLLNQLLNKVGYIPYSRWEDLLSANVKLVETIKKLEFDSDIQLTEYHELEVENKQLQSIINGDRFIPLNRPNLDLAVDTIIGWNNNRTIVTFFKRLLMKVDDSVITTVCKYVKTEIKKRGLNNHEEQ